MSLFESRLTVSVNLVRMSRSFPSALTRIRIRSLTSNHALYVAGNGSRCGVALLASLLRVVHSDLASA